jgi:DNA-directed RNA polymerase subunit N (RpoN/RPB10)
MAATDRPFKCSVCRRSFRSHSSLVKHFDEHSAPRRCKNCGKQLRDNEYHRC